MFTIVSSAARTMISIVLPCPRAQLLFSRVRCPVIGAALGALQEHLICCFNAWRPLLTNKLSVIGNCIVKHSLLISEFSTEKL